jgi:hypothetical protein
MCFYTADHLFTSLIGPGISRRWVIEETPPLPPGRPLVGRSPGDLRGKKLLGPLVMAQGEVHVPRDPDLVGPWDNIHP